MKKLTAILFILTLPAGCFSDPGMNGSVGTDGTDGTDTDGTESGSSTGSETGTGTETGSETGMDAGTDETGSTGDTDGGMDVPPDMPNEPDPLGEPCDPVDQADPCVGDYTCSLYEWDNVGNFFEFICEEYVGDPAGGGFGDPVNGWGECKTGFMPLNNIGLDKFPDGICPGAGNGGTCCTPICSVDDPTCPADMMCNLFLEPMNPEIYATNQYGNCIRQ